MQGVLILDFRWRIFRFLIVKQRLHLQLVVFLAVVISACSGSQPVKSTADYRTVEDDLGRSVQVPVRIDRAISLAPSLTEMIFAVGADDRLVGVTTYCNYPEEAKAIQKIGDTQTPNIEGIIALKPQIVFVSTASQLEAFTETLEEQGISVFVSDQKTVDEVFDDLVTLGDLFGRPDEAVRLATRLQSRAKFYWHERKRETEPQEPPSVFVQFSNEPLFTVGKGSYVTQVVEYAGGESVTRDLPTAYPMLSKETALALNPEVIILSDSDDNREPNAVFKNSPAVKNGRVYRIDADIISRPGPRLVDAIEQIAGFLAEQNRPPE